MNSKSVIMAGRAVASTMIRRILLRVVYLICGISAAVLIILFVLMSTYSAWWGLLIPLALLGLAAGVIALLATNFAIDRLAPRQLNRDERAKITSFVDDMNGKIVAGSVVKKSPFMIALYAIVAFFKGGRDGAAKSILSPIEEIKDLRGRFNELISMFDDGRAKVDSDRIS